MKISLGDFGKALNKVTAPIGVRLAPGGPYADGGAGDKAEDLDKQARENYKWLGDYGKSLLGGLPTTPVAAPGSPAYSVNPRGGTAGYGAGARTPGAAASGSYAAPTRTPPTYAPGTVTQNGRTKDVMTGLGDASLAYENAVNGGLGPGNGALQGYAQQLPVLLQQLAAMSGVQGNNDPYAMSPYEQAQYNQEQGLLAAQRGQADAHLRQQLAARGITGGAAMESALQSLHDHFDGETKAHTTQFAQNMKAQRLGAVQNLLAGYGNLATQQEGQYTDRLNALRSVLDMYNQRLGQGTSLVGAQAGGLQNSAGLYQNQAQLNSANSNRAWDTITDLVGGGLRFAADKALESAANKKKT